MSRHNKNYLVIIFIIFIPLLLLPACIIINSVQEEKESSIILDTSCEPPCWQNIVPGITTSTEVYEVLHEITWINEDSIQNTSDGTIFNCIKWLASNEAGDYSGRIYLNDNLVTLIKIGPKEGVIEFSDLINKLGEPESILAYYSKREITTISVFVLYPSEGYGFLNYYDSPNLYPGNSILISPQDQVKLVWYGEPKFYYDYLTIGPIGKYSLEFIEQTIQPWNGYGEYLLEKASY
jgi:hypothetical protein